jgi:hypothetical protein
MLPFDYRSGQGMAGNDEEDMTTKMMFEQIREDIKKLGEGFDDLKRQHADDIKELVRTWDSKWSPHDLAIRDHGRRIGILERRRQRPRRS